MRRTLFLLPLLLGAFGLSAVAQRHVPTFAEYSVKSEKVRAKDISFKQNPNARRFRTALRDSLREGVNFAGHYVVASWGCGTACLTTAIIDARTGIVFWPRDISAINAYFDDPIQYKVNSRLLILSEPTQDERRKVSYYEWKNNLLHLIHSETRKDN